MAKPCSASLGNDAELPEIILHRLYPPRSALWVQNCMEHVTLATLWVIIVLQHKAAQAGLKLR